MRIEDIRSFIDLAEFQQQPSAASSQAAISEEAMWDNLKYFLKRVVPVAEQAGVKLAMHPDDPPGLPQLLGQPRIMGSIEQFERLVALEPSPVNGIDTWLKPDASVS